MRSAVGRFSQDIAGMAYGKAIFAISPLVQALDPSKREVVFRYLRDEDEDFDSSIRGILEAGPVTEAVEASDQMSSGTAPGRSKAEGKS